MLVRQKAPVFLALTDLLGLAFALELAGWLLLGRTAGLSIPFVALACGTTLVILYVLEAYILDKRNWGARMALKTALGSILSAGTIVVAADVAYTIGVARALPDGMVVLGFGLFLPWSIIVRLGLVLLTYRRDDIEKWGILGVRSWVDELQGAAGGERKLIYLGDVPDTDEAPVSKADKSEGIGALLAGSNLTGVVIATREPLSEEMIDRIKKAEDGLRVVDCVDFYEKHLYKVPIFLSFEDGRSRFLQKLTPPIQRIQIRLKRVIDILASTALLVISSPLLLVVALLIKLDSPGPVIYRQIRVGKNGKEFQLYKFRTMIEEAELEGPVWTDEGDSRITRIGKYLRITRFDELPQFWNVVVNEMSLVGPRAERPMFVRWLANEIPCYNQRHLVKPGITGWAQVMYKYGSTLEDARRKLEYDLFYIKYFSLMLDTLIFLKTIRVMFFVRGR